MTAGTDLSAAQEALQSAQRDRAEVIEMRSKTEENARQARGVLRENHFAERIKRSLA